MIDFKAAVAEALSESPATPKTTVSLSQFVEAQLEDIEAGLSAGATIRSIAARAGVSEKRLSEALVRARRKRDGLTVLGAARKIRAGSSRPINAPGAAAAFGKPVIPVAAPPKPALNIPNLRPAAPTAGKHYLSPAAREAALKKKPGGLDDGVRQQAVAEQALIDSGRRGEVESGGFKKQEPGQAEGGGYKTSMQQAQERIALRNSVPK